GIRDDLVTGVQTCALPIYVAAVALEARSRSINVVGNVLGAYDKAFMYEVHSNPPGTGQAAVYRIGHRGNGGNGGGDSNVYEAPRSEERRVGREGTPRGGRR